MIVVMNQYNARRQHASFFVLDGFLQTIYFLTKYVCINCRTLSAADCFFEFLGLFVSLCTSIVETVVSFLSCHNMWDLP